MLLWENEYFLTSNLLCSFTSVKLCPLDIILSLILKTKNYQNQYFHNYLKHFYMCLYCSDITSFSSGLSYPQCDQFYARRHMTLAHINQSQCVLCVFVLQPAGAKKVKSRSFVLDPSGKLRRRVRRGTGRIMIHLKPLPSCISTLESYKVNITLYISTIQIFAINVSIRFNISLHNISLYHF